MRAMFLILLVFFVGCSTSQKAFNTTSAPQIVTVLVENNSIESVKVYDPYGARVGTVFPGRSECIKLHQRNMRGSLRIETVGGYGRYYTPEFQADPDIQPGWVLSLGNNLTVSMISLRPYKPCK